ncbi:hypothetical protein AB0M54_34450 [Actinoplanes sp. NPDC051470]|uniref:hypothetical protein n=1 Tax=unclassified Actinoplanes TaxID=2626549 RepID=UPI0034330B5B
MKREPSWRDLGRSAAELLKSLDLDLRGCSAGTDTTGPARKVSPPKPPRPGFPRDWR